MRTDGLGRPLVPGVNVDRVDVAAGLALAAQLGYGDPRSQMVIEYALMRWRRGEEAGADRTARSHGISFTSWRASLAAAVAEEHALDRLARGEAVPGHRGACARPGCGHGKPWHTPKTRLRRCERCGCPGWVSNDRPA